MCRYHFQIELKFEHYFLQPWWCRYNRQIACIIAPAVCGIIGLVLINSGILYIRRAYIHSKVNPVSVESGNEEMTLAKVDRRLAVRILMSM